MFFAFMYTSVLMGHLRPDTDCSPRIRWKLRPQFGLLPVQIAGGVRGDIWVCMAYKSGAIVDGLCYCKR